MEVLSWNFEGLRQTTMNLIQDGQCPYRDSNRVLPEQQSIALGYIKLFDDNDDYDGYNDDIGTDGSCSYRSDDIRVYIPCYKFYKYFVEAVLKLRKFIFVQSSRSSFKFWVERTASIFRVQV